MPGHTTRMQRISSIWRPGEDSRRDPVTVETVSAPWRNCRKRPEFPIMFWRCRETRSNSWISVIFFPAAGRFACVSEPGNPLPIRPRTLICASTSVTSPVTIPKPHSASVNGRSPLRQTARSSTKWTSTSAKFRATPSVVNIPWASDRTLPNT